MKQEAVNAYLIVIGWGYYSGSTSLYKKNLAILLGFCGLDPVGKKLELNLLAALLPVLGPCWMIGLKISSLAQSLFPLL